MMVWYLLTADEGLVTDEVLKSIIQQAIVSGICEFLSCNKSPICPMFQQYLSMVFFVIDFNRYPNTYSLPPPR